MITIMELNLNFKLQKLDYRLKINDPIGFRKDLMKLSKCQRHRV